MSKKYEEIEVGDIASYTKKITKNDLLDFASVTGDNNPIHVDDEVGAMSQFGKCIAHGMVVGGLFGTVLGMGYVGPGALYLKQDITFESPVCVDDEITVKAVVIEKLSKNRVRFKTYAINNKNVEVAIGEAIVKVPN